MRFETLHILFDLQGVGNHVIQILESVESVTTRTSGGRDAFATLVVVIIATAACTIIVVIVRSNGNVVTTTKKSYSA